MVNTFYICPSTMLRQAQQPVQGPFAVLNTDTARSVPTHQKIYKKCILNEEFQGLRCTRNRSLLDVNEDFECERNAEITI